MSTTYKGKAKTVEELEDNPSRIRIIFRDDVTAGDGAKKATIEGKGELGAKISNFLFELLEDTGIPTHLLEIESPTTVIARKVKILPIEVVVRNITAGSIARRYNINEGIELNEPLVEFFLKDDELHDPVIPADTAIALGYANEIETQILRARALQVNRILKSLFEKAGLLLVDFKLEFGKDKTGRLYLADEISGDSMRVWDAETREKLDKDRFRRDIAPLLQGYAEIWDRISKVDFDVPKLDLDIAITIRSKDSVPNPGSEVVKRTMKNWGIKGLENVAVNKSIVVTLSDTKEYNWKTDLEKITRELLSNPLIETFTLDVR